MKTPKKVKTPKKKTSIKKVQEELVYAFISNVSSGGYLN